MISVILEKKKEKQIGQEYLCCHGRTQELSWTDTLSQNETSSDESKNMEISTLIYFVALVIIFISIANYEIG